MEKTTLAEVLQTPKRRKRRLQKFRKRQNGENGLCGSSASVKTLLDFDAAEGGRAAQNDGVRHVEGVGWQVGTFIVEAAEGGADARVNAPRRGYAEGDAAKGAVDVDENFGVIKVSTTQVEVDAPEGAAEDGATKDGFGEESLRAAERGVDTDKAVGVGRGTGGRCTIALGGGGVGDAAAAKE